MFMKKGRENRKTILSGIIGLVVLLCGCEAKLDLSGVEATQKEPTRRYDHYQAAAKSPEAVVVVGNHGVLLVSHDNGENWNRHPLPGSDAVSFPTLVDIDVCPDGRFVALDTDRRIWSSGAKGQDWTAKTIPTEEEVLGLTCDQNGTLWVVGSFTLIMESRDRGENWTDKSISEDAVFGSVQFMDRKHGFVTGEFGSVYTTSDGGESWQAAPSIPHEFYPMASFFSSPQKGWVGGLQGIIFQTEDGGQNWQRQKTGTVAPIYTIFSVGSEIYAIGEQGTLLGLSKNEWRPVGASLGFGYLRAGLALGGERFLVAGGRGTVKILNQHDF